jgi:hypothetical protein
MQTRSLVGVSFCISYSEERQGGLRYWQTRSDVFVGAEIWYSSDEHERSCRQMRSEVAVGPRNSNCEDTAQVDSGRQVRSDVCVGGCRWYWLLSQTVMGKHTRSDDFVGGAASNSNDVHSVTGRQVRDPGELEIVPGAQAVHVLAPLLLCDVPGGHGMHVFGDVAFSVDE